MLLFPLQGFHKHVKDEHNQWAYLFFFIHLDETRPNDYSALELYVYKLVNILFLFSKVFFNRLSKFKWGAQWLSGRASDSGVEVGVQTLPCCVLEQDILLPESTGNTQKAVAPSQHD